MALWDSPKIETRDTSRRLIFMSVLGEINGAFSHCIMLFNGAIHLIKRTFLKHLCFLLFTYEEAQRARANISLCVAAVSALQAVFMHHDGWFCFSLFFAQFVASQIGVLRRKDLNKALAYWIWFAFIWSWQSVAFDDYIYYAFA